MSKKHFPIILVLIAFVLPSFLYFFANGFLGYDSYYFLAEVCGGNPIYDAPSNAPLHDLLLPLLSCNDFLLKLLLVLLFGASMLIIYTIGEDYNKGWGVTTTLFVMVSPILLYNSFKFENDAFGFPFIFLAMLFFLRHLKNKENNSKNLLNLCLTLFCLLIGVGFWGGAVYPLLFFSLFEPLLLVITIPFFIIFFDMLSSGAFPRFDVNENNPLQGMLSVLFFIGQLVFPQNRKVFNFPYRNLTLVFVGFGLINPKFMVLALPLIGLALANAFNIANPEARQKMLILATMCIIGFSLPIGLGSLHPNNLEHEAVRDLVKIGFDENLVVFNDWSYGHMVYFYGGETYQHSSPDMRLVITNDLNKGIVLTRQDLNCLMIKQYDFPVVNPALRLYKC